ncbi:hypothetical protein [Nonomuraea sp. GTA35]|uniref:hypothetical protein n=1 Tax=Nonomuraea sp. GTA35 TaxID=1676746 RepID=UPI0035C10A56
MKKAPAAVAAATLRGAAPVQAAGFGSGPKAGTRKAGSMGLRLRRQSVHRHGKQALLEPRRAGTVPLDEAAYAYRAFRAGGHRGRWVLTS